EAGAPSRGGAAPAGRPGRSERSAAGLPARRRDRAVPPPATSRVIWGRAGVVAVGLALIAGSSGAAGRVAVAWHPSKPKLGEVAWLHVRDGPEGASVEGSGDGRPVRFFSSAGGQAALIGIDLEAKPGTHLWKVGVVEPGREPRNAQGSVTIARRSFPQERLTLPQTMVDLEPGTEKRAGEETRQLTTLYRTVTPDRLWRGKFTKPVGTQAPGTGCGARRIINGQPRSPHAASDP